MIVKVLFTMLVIIVVGMIFRNQNQSKAAEQARKQKTSPPAADETSSLAPRTVAYLLVALLILVSGVVYYFSWSDANQLVTLRITSATGELVEYQAYRKNIKDREFTTIDGIRTRLADTDRLEMLVNQ